MLESIDGLAFSKLNERLFKYLKDMSKRYNKKVLPVTHQEIAKDMNTSRVVISRIIKQLQEEGKIISTRNKIKVLEFKK